jgi:hypothetical protein
MKVKISYIKPNCSWLCIKIFQLVIIGLDILYEEKHTFIINLYILNFEIQFKKGY